jgi:Fe-S-cluster-containing hydrogenase component 2
VETKEFMVIRCVGCTLSACKVTCKEEALVLVAGDLLLALQKCSVCKQYKGGALPECIAECSKASLKLILDQKPEFAKRESAVLSNSLGV